MLYGIMVLLQQSEHVVIISIKHCAQNILLMRSVESFTFLSNFRCDSRMIMMMTTYMMKINSISYISYIVSPCEAVKQYYYCFTSQINKQTKRTNERPERVVANGSFAGRMAAKPKSKHHIWYSLCINNVSHTMK